MQFTKTILNYLGAITAILLFSNPLDAFSGSFGKTREEVEYLQNDWTKIYFETEKLNFNAFVPNYKNCSMLNGSIHFFGFIEEEIYKISVFQLSQIPDYNVIVEDLRTANKNHIVYAIELNNPAIQLSVDLIATSPDDVSCRFIFKDHYLIKIITTDLNREKSKWFFDSFLLQD